MKKIIITIMIIIFVAVFVGNNKTLFPSRQEITNLAMSRIIGIDISDKEVRLRSNYK